MGWDEEKRKEEQEKERKKEIDQKGVGGRERSRNREENCSEIQAWRE